MTSKYAISGKSAAPRATAKQRGYDTDDARSRDIIRGITEREKTIARLRREQEELRDQLARQREWINSASPDDPLWSRRCQIHQDRIEQDREIDRQLEDWFDMQNAQIESLEEPNRSLAIQRLMMWSEPPFVAALFVVMAGVLA